MTLDYVSVLQQTSDVIVGAIDKNRTAPVPWCGDWRVQDVGHHVATLHHVITGVIDGRPTATFQLFETLHPPKPDDPALAAYLREGTASLVDRLRTLPPTEEVWTFWEPDHTVGFFARRSSQETFVHGWDAARAAGMATPVIGPEFAADGIAEYLDLFLSMMRGMQSAPGAGETVHLHCTDTAGEWLLAFPEAGATTVTREHAKGDVAFRGPAEGLLLYLWSRLPADEAGVEVIGDTSLAARWPELVPAI